VEVAKKIEAHRVSERKEENQKSLQNDSLLFQEKRERERVENSSLIKNRNFLVLYVREMLENSVKTFL
jgi:hypothetical protein